ncbi:hypothetical protein LX32DRAFT_220194 [Colletotrichum zoysiae]|uniref:Uncharacterized protein n=1 Tax=Colletotrichum zoysiae TaxID=1216348 RepID=A0AAD9M7N0_9PEZI|nr:hypothetical protein LX32DRAFT_220194 [Colletotrichum zoysiae]
MDPYPSRSRRGALNPGLVYQASCLHVHTHARPFCAYFQCQKWQPFPGHYPESSWRREPVWSNVYVVYGLWCGVVWWKPATICKFSLQRRSPRRQDPNNSVRGRTKKSSVADPATVEIREHVDGGACAMPPSRNERMGQRPRLTSAVCPQLRSCGSGGREALQRTPRTHHGRRWDERGDGLKGLR